MLNTIPLIFDEKQHQTVQWNNTIMRPLTRKQCGQTIKAVEDKNPNIKGISHRTVGAIGACIEIHIGKIKEQ